MENTSYENKSIPTPEKRKRGRPRKTEVQIKPVQELAPKRGRGRPKKDPTNPVKKISREQFWKFQSLNADLTIAEERAKLIELGLKNLSNEAEIIKGKMLHLKTRGMDEARKKIDEARTAFNSFTEEIEGILGVSLKNKTIDEKTLEVKDSTVET